MILDFLHHSPSFIALQKALASGESILFESLWDTPKAIIAAEVQRQTKKNVLVLTGGMREDRFFENLESIHPKRTIEFPAWETLPGEEIAPSPDIIGKRFEALQFLIQRKDGCICLCPLQSLLQKVLPKDLLAPLLTVWKKKTRVDFKGLPQFLSDLGYKPSAAVSDKGEFALRGGILDIFPVASPDPFRIEFWGDEIEEIRKFDPVGQKSVGSAEEVFICPAQELMLLKKATHLCPITDYLGSDFVILWDDITAIEETFVAIKDMPGAKSAFFYSLSELIERLKTGQHLFGAPESIENLSEVRKNKERTQHLQTTSFEAFHHTFEAQRWFHPFQKPADFFTSQDLESDDFLDLLPKDPAFPIIFLNATDTEEEELKRQLASHSIAWQRKIRFERGQLTSGFVVVDLPLAVIPHSEITGKSPIRRQKWRSTTHTPASEFHQLAPNDLVVHFHSGIGRYLGMEKLANHLGQETEFLAIQYADDSKLYVPLSQAYLVSRYIGSNEEAPHLSQLGTKRWQNTRNQAQQQILGYANDLLRLYAERAIQGGFRYPPDSPTISQFARDFPYTETSDQLLAIQAIQHDMMSDKSMDRLICGDVGYGKTEVAMRAAFKAVIDGTKQVAVLVPTTVLAMQHYETFKQRMSGYPVRIGVVSRFCTAKQNRQTLEKIAAGEIDVLIGTHRLLSEDVLFKDLGLLIIDEEQRFGVRAKERLKRFKAGVDCLTLSATPIPRTLYMSLIHARDMTVINTPPQDRLPVKSIIAETDMEMIQNALMREFARGGQAFFIHNRVETIFGRAEAIQQIVPSARIAAVHGQMDSDDIDPIFHKFQNGLVDLLFATTIVENGIDIPNANTIIIDRADTYGLADLYQLRGRVGRWNRTAYAYFLIPKNANLSEIARKRLNALVEAGGYGGGMKIAMRDLEIRGAGDILGVQQSGQVSAIGFHLYCKLLKRAIDALKKKAPISFNESKIEFPYDARIPESYVNEVSLRMELYYRLGESAAFSDIDELLSEMTDRFGEPPEPVIWLYHLSRLRVFAAANQFSLLKFQNLSLYAEQIFGKETERHTIVMPKKFTSGAEMEKHVIPLLRAHFNCSKDL
ncbi:MAG: mfd [Parachlamydiales bacterium]|nr:mfd [Parachlamydiales bacterium]